MNVHVILICADITTPTIGVARVEVRAAGCGNVYHLSLRAALAGGGKDGGKDSGKGFDPDDPEFVDRIARTIHIGNLANEATSLNHSAAHGCCQ